MQRKSKENIILDLIILRKFVSKKRKIQLFLVFILMNISGILEIFTLASVIPFINILTNPEKVLENKFINLLGINNNEELFIFIPIWGRDPGVSSRLCASSFSPACSVRA